MKQFSIFLMAFVALVASSCSKNYKETTVNTQAEKHDSLHLPSFDESNSRLTGWDNLPAEMKNAEMFKTADMGQSANLKTAGYYSNTIGPWGGSGGSAFSIVPSSDYRIYAIGIRSGGYVDRLIIWYQNVHTNVILASREVGGTGGSLYIQYFSSSEYIYALGGRSGGYVDRLTFYTNYKSFSYGGNGGSPFYVSVGSGFQILGFWGKSGGYLDQIGFYVYTR